MTSATRIGMRQIHYFLAAAEELNFTRAANKCNVSQPSLTRAILRLEDDMGGPLFRRERSLTHLTELGEQIQPLLKKVIENAEQATDLAKSIQTQKTVKLNLGMPRHVPLGPFAPHLLKLTEAFPDFDFRVTRGCQPDLAEKLKSGELDIVVGCVSIESWERFELWNLFHCDFKLVFSRDHALANKSTIATEDLKGISLLHRQYCPMSENFRHELADSGVKLKPAPYFGCDEDLVAFLSASRSMAYLPSKVRLSKDLIQRDLDFPGQGFDLHAITVAGRKRGAALSFLLDELTGTDWPTVLAA